MKSPRRLDTVKRMRFSLAALVAMSLCSGTSAQGWFEYINMDDYFIVNMPGEPVVTQTTRMSAFEVEFPADWLGEPGLYADEGMHRLSIAKCRELRGHAGPRSALDASPPDGARSRTPEGSGPRRPAQRRE